MKITDVLHVQYNISSCTNNNVLNYVCLHDSGVKYTSCDVLYYIISYVRIYIAR